MSNISIILDDKKNIKSVRKLWEQIFYEDSSSYLDFYFSHVYDKNIVVLAKDQESVIGMIHLNPYELEDASLYYIVGVATLPEYRGQGIMRKMMEFAIQYADEKKIRNIMLLPVDERFYTSFGFEFVSKQYNTQILRPSQTYGDTIKGKKYLPPLYVTDELNALEDFIFRMKELKMQQGNVYLPYEPVWNLKYLTNLFLEMKSEGGKIISVDGHLVLFYEEDVVEVRTIFFHPQQPIDRIKDWLIDVAKNRTIILHEVNHTKISNLFSYHQQNTYDMRPYMMILNDATHPFRQHQDNFFNEVV